MGRDAKGGGCGHRGALAGGDVPEGSVFENHTHHLLKKKNRKKKKQHKTTTTTPTPTSSSPAARNTIKSSSSCSQAGSSHHHQSCAGLCGVGDRRDPLAHPAWRKDARASRALAPQHVPPGVPIPAVSRLARAQGHGWTCAASHSEGMLRATSGTS